MTNPTEDKMTEEELRVFIEGQLMQCAYEHLLKKKKVTPDSVRSITEYVMDRITTNAR